MSLSNGLSNGSPKSWGGELHLKLKIDDLVKGPLNVMPDFISLPRQLVSRGHPELTEITGFPAMREMTKNAIFRFFMSSSKICP
jgi:hypothetical protein